MFRSLVLRLKPLSVFFRLQPLTLWGAVICALSILILKVLALKEMDLILSVISVAMLCLITLAALVGGLNTARCRRKLKCAIHLRSLQLYSREPIESVLQLKDADLFPGFRMLLRLRFEHPGTTNQSYLLSSTAQEMSLVGTVYFPHRGMWHLSACEFRIEDFLGLTAFSWEQPELREFEVHPLPTLETIFPEPQSGSSAGDFSSPNRERTGDLYDIKAYDPSDGLSRIMWKQYAKSRTLIVRRPEPAVLPQNEIAVYLIAARDEDEVAAACLRYISELEQSGVSVLFGTDGAEAKTLPVTGIQNITTSALRVVWSPKVGSGIDFRAFVQALQSRPLPPTEVMAFFGETQGLGHALAEIAQAAGISFTPVPVLAPEVVSPKYSPTLNTLASAA